MLNGLADTADNMCDLEDEKCLRDNPDARWYLDDISGEALDPALARKARQEELDAFEERQVYKVVPRTSMPRRSSVVGVRWVEVNTGTKMKPKVRSRLVCQEFNRGTHPDELYAPTPPVMATRWLIMIRCNR